MPRRRRGDAKEAPETFRIPAREDRDRLGRGDLVTPVFRIAVDDEAEPVSAERMWVLVRERVDGAYLGVLDNDPFALAENDGLWSGIEIPFEPRHVINIEIEIDPADEAGLAKAQEPPKRRWRWKCGRCVTMEASPAAVRAAGLEVRAHAKARRARRRKGDGRLRGH